MLTVQLKSKVTRYLPAHLKAILGLERDNYSNERFLLRYQRYRLNANKDTDDAMFCSFILLLSIVSLNCMNVFFVFFFSNTFDIAGSIEIGLSDRDVIIMK